MNLKPFIYRYFGIYLASKEELEYVKSREIWQLIDSKDLAGEDELSSRDRQGLAIGLWQADQGYGRMFVAADFKRPRWFWKPLAWVQTLFLQIYYDIRSLF